MMSYIQGKTRWYILRVPFQHVTFVTYAANCGHAQEMILSLGRVLAKCSVDIKCVWPD